MSWGTLGKIFAAGLLAYLAVVLWPLLSLLLVALLIAITLFPILLWVRRRGGPDWLGILLVAVLLAGSIALFGLVIFPTVGNEGVETIKRLPSIQSDLVQRLPAPLREPINQLFVSWSFSNPEPLMKQFLAWGTVALQGLGEFLVVLVLAVYFVADGERVFRWLLAFFRKNIVPRLNWPPSKSAAWSAATCSANL